MSKQFTTQDILTSREVEQVIRNDGRMTVSVDRDGWIDGEVLIKSHESLRAKLDDMRDKLSAAIEQKISWEKQACEAEDKLDISIKTHQENANEDYRGIRSSASVRSFRVLKMLGYQVDSSKGTANDNL